MRACGFLGVVSCLSVRLGPTILCVPRVAKMYMCLSSCRVVSLQGMDEVTLARLSEWEFVMNQVRISLTHTRIRTNTQSYMYNESGREWVFVISRYEHAFDAHTHARTIL